MNLTDLDGRAVPAGAVVGFAASFSQTAPVTFSYVEGAAVAASWFVFAKEQSVDYEEAQGGGDGDRVEVGAGDAVDGKGKAQKEEEGGISDVERQMLELEDLRGQAIALHELIVAKEAVLMKQLGRPFHPPRPPPGMGGPHRITPLAECDSMRCLIHSLIGKFRQALGAHGLGGHYPFPRPHHGNSSFGNHPWPPFCTPFGRPPHDGPPHGKPPHGEPPHEKPPHEKPPHAEPPLHHPPNGDNDREAVLAGGANDQAEHPMMPPEDAYSIEGLRRHKPMVRLKIPFPTRESPELTPQLQYMTKHPVVTAMGIAAIAFGLFSLCGIHALHSRLSRRSRPERRAQWRAWRQSRRQRRHQSREERRARRHERKEAVKAFFRAAARRVFARFLDEEKEAERRREFDENTSTATVEAEIAGFREAATMVAGMVAMEEGQRLVQAEEATPLYVGSESDDEVLPAYDDDSSVVADGFRYTPGSSEMTPSPASSDFDSLSSSGSDRLGYNK